MKISPPEKPAWSDSSWYILTIIVFITLVSTAGYGLIQQQKRFLLNEKQNELSTIADLKTFQLVQWRKERFAEGTSIRANAMMAHRINACLAGRDNATIHREINRWLANLIDLGEYNEGSLFTPDGVIITSNANQKLSPSKHDLELVEEAAEEHEIILSDFHRDYIGKPFDINLAIPIMNLDGLHSRCVAVLVLDIDPTKRLYPLIQSWPTSSSTAETLLVKREGDSVMFLNELRHRKKTSTPFERPLADKNMPAARAVLGQEGSFEGIDYRNAPVLCATRVIPGTRWGMVAKIDMSEVMAPLSKSIMMVTLIGFVVIITMILGLFLFGIRRRAETLRKMFEIEQQHNIELQKSEDSLIRSRDYHMKLLEIFPSLIWRSGTDGRCNYFNQTWLAFTGRTMEEEIGEGWVDGVHPDDRERCIACYTAAFQAQQAFTMEYRLRFHDGSYHWINDHGCPYYDLDGDFAGYIGSCYDITVQKSAESELQGIHARLERQIIERTSDLSEINSLLRSEIEERKQLEQQLLSAKRLEAIGQIAGGVAHEVRNPLNAILTITEALFRENEVASNPEFEPFILHIRTQVNRLVHLMNDLLDLGRTIPTANLQPVALYELCRETLDLWKSTGMSHNRRGLLTSDNNNTSLQVLADAHKLQQVFFNLLENAGYYTPEDHNIVMKIIHSDSNKPENMAIVLVGDQGTGIPEEKLSHVFDPFYTDRKGGTGLGLALVKHFVEDMGGSVQIWNNNPPPGCTVEVRIPIYREETQ
ncbi:MAG: PAS domain-containing sensor histidine kinase [Pelobacteraceae bacterium]